ncbi:MAG TPA: hypothetical protein VFA83_19195 [Acidimicrobiales bacterium]|nr:hypothetical protein [Acidimicrobiales bacterium]
MAAHLRRAALAGAATGLRSTVGLAALVNAKGPGLPAALRGAAARPAAAIGVATELVLDKLPFTGSRLEPPGLAGRLVFAAGAGAALARAAGRPVLPAAAVACVASLAAAKAGHDARAAAAERFPPLAVALAEDALAVALAAAAARA